MIELTVFAKDGGPLTKTISLAADGSLKSDASACLMIKGTARRFQCELLRQFGDLIPALKTNEALAVGTLRQDLPDNVRVTTKRKLNGSDWPDIIARTQDYLVYRPGQPAFVPIDFDQKGMPTSVASVMKEHGGLWPALVSVLPALEGTARIERASTSAGLFDKRTGEKFPSSGGRHIYPLIKDGADAQRFLKTLHERCWLAELGWMMVGTGGQLLERSIVDRVCGGPERLVFEGPPVLIHPVDQDLNARKPIAVEGEAVDTRAACPSLTVVDLAKLRELRAKERNRLAGDAAKAREAFVDGQSRRLAQRTGMDLHRARRTIERQCAGVLLLDVELPFDDPELAGKTVADVLANPAAFEGETLADPLEGVDYGRSKAMIMRRRDGSVWINSFAHGRTTYELKVDFCAAKAALQKATEDNAAETLAQLVLIGDLANDEIEVLRNLSHKISGINKRTLDRKLRKLRSINPDGELHADLIRAFNAQYAVVNEAGKAMVYERVRDPMINRYVIVRSRFDDFRKFYQNQSVEVTAADGTPKRKSAGEFWLDHPKRRQYLGGVVFDPTGKVGPDYWNLWSGFGVEPKHGDWSLIQDHLLRVVCGGNRDHFDFLLNTTARMFQEPAKPAEVAVVLRGKKGSGKGVFCVHLVKAWGQHGAHIANSKHLVGNFNNHLRDCVMLFADEAFFAGDRQHESVLKALITEPTLPIEGKYMDVVFVRNMLHVYMSSNSDWVVPASHDERRYFVLDVLDTHLGDRSYFNALYKQMEEGGLAAMIYDMLNDRNISSFDPRDVPRTEALVDQHRRSLDSLDRWWLTVLERGFIWRSRFGIDEFGTWFEFCTTQLLERSYLQWCADTRTQRPDSRIALGVRMSEMYSPARPRGDQIIGEVETWPPGLAKNQVIIKTSGRPPGYTLNSLEEARDRFAEIRGVSGDWSLPIDKFDFDAAKEKKA
jgi:hypothetical protein